MGEGVAGPDSSREPAWLTGGMMGARLKEAAGLGGLRSPLRWSVACPSLRPGEAPLFLTGEQVGLSSGPF